MVYSIISRQFWTRCMCYSSLILILLSFVSCSSGPTVSPALNSSVQRSLPVSLKKDSWGHRAGPRGFDTVVIDAGHGGKDPGASVSGVHEKELALDTALRLKKALQNDFHIVLLRDDDRFLDLDKRAALASARRGAVFLSLHYNHGPSWVRGPETYYWRVDSHGLATRIQRKMEKVSPRERSNAGLTRRRLRLTRNVRVPSVLVEVGYLSNYSERSLAKKASYRERMARAIAEAVREQAKYGDAGTGTKPAPLWSPLSRKGDRSKL